MVFNAPLITVQELIEAIKSHPITLLDCTIDKVGQSLKHEELELIPNSLFFEIEEKLSDKTSTLPHTLVSPVVFEREMQLLGINQDSTIVLYDRWGIYSSPRAWWMFKVMGFDHIYILNGGLPHWKKNHLPTSNTYKTTTVKGNFQSKYNASWYADKAYILKHYQENTINIFDARSKGRFTGLLPEPRKGLNSGHIPHSTNIPFEEVLAGQVYKEKDEIASIFQQHSPYSNEQVFSCGSGITASILAFASYLIGAEKIRVYDGSWTEWGNDKLNLPTAK